MAIEKCKMLVNFMINSQIMLPKWWLYVKMTPLNNMKG